MPVRLRAPTRPVPIVHDGDELTAELGEPLAHALLAADRPVLTRSPKLHRPRGPYCLRGGCEGCLVRVDGVPNVMACLHRVNGGEVVETQNVLGSREVDLLAATDFLFPHGIDHHRLFAGVRGVSSLVTTVARRVAGLGRLPDASREVSPSEAREVDVLIVGGGGAGLAAAIELGARATLVDDQLELGGALRLLDPARCTELVAQARAGGAELLRETTAAGVYAQSAANAPPWGVLLSAKTSTQLLFPRAIVIATGEHDPTPDFPGNELPGVMSARAGLALLERGVLPDARAAVVGAGPFAERVARELGEHVVLRTEAGRVHGIHGRGRVRSVAIVDRPTRATRRVSVGCVLYDGPASPAVELAVQAGTDVRFDATRGYVPVVDEQGRASERLWCAGRACGFDADSIEHGRAVARAVTRALTAR